MAEDVAATPAPEPTAAAPAPAAEEEEVATTPAPEATAAAAAPAKEEEEEGGADKPMGDKEDIAKEEKGSEAKEREDAAAGPGGQKRPAEEMEEKEDPEERAKRQRAEEERKQKMDKMLAMGQGVRPKEVAFILGSFGLMMGQESKGYKLQMCKLHMLGACEKGPQCPNAHSIEEFAMAQEHQERLEMRKKEEKQATTTTAAAAASAAFGSEATTAAKGTEEVAQGYTETAGQEGYGLAGAAEVSAEALQAYYQQIGNPEEAQDNSAAFGQQGGWGADPSGYAGMQQQAAYFNGPGAGRFRRNPKWGQFGH